MNDDASGKHVLSKSSEGNKLTSYARQPQLDRTTHSLTRSLAVVCGKDKTGVQDSTPPMQPAQLCALLKLTKSNNE